MEREPAVADGDVSAVAVGLGSPKNASAATSYSSISSFQSTAANEFAPAPMEEGPSLGAADADDAGSRLPAMSIAYAAAAPLARAAAGELSIETQHTPGGEAAAATGDGNGGSGHSSASATAAGAAALAASAAHAVAPPSAPVDAARPATILSALSLLRTSAAPPSSPTFLIEGLSLTPKTEASGSASGSARSDSSSEPLAAAPVRVSTGAASAEVASAAARISAGAGVVSPAPAAPTEVVLRALPATQLPRRVYLESLLVSADAALDAMLCANTYASPPMLAAARAARACILRLHRIAAALCCAFLFKDAGAAPRPIDALPVLPPSEGVLSALAAGCEASGRAALSPFLPRKVALAQVTLERADALLSAALGQSSRALAKSAQVDGSGGNAGGGKGWWDLRSLVLALAAVALEAVAGAAAAAEESIGEAPSTPSGPVTWPPSSALSQPFLDAFASGLSRLARELVALGLRFEVRELNAHLEPPLLSHCSPLPPHFEHALRADHVGAEAVLAFLMPPSMRAAMRIALSAPQPAGLAQPPMAASIARWGSRAVLQQVRGSVRVRSKAGSETSESPDSGPKCSFLIRYALALFGEANLLEPLRAIGEAYGFVSSSAPHTAAAAAAAAASSPAQSTLSFHRCMSALADLGLVRLVSLPLSAWVAAWTCATEMATHQSEAGGDVVPASAVVSVEAVPAASSDSSLIASRSVTEAICRNSIPAASGFALVVAAGIVASAYHTVGSCGIDALCDTAVVRVALAQAASAQRRANAAAPPEDALSPDAGSARALASARRNSSPSIIRGGGSLRSGSIAGAASKASAAPSSPLSPGVVASGTAQFAPADVGRGQEVGRDAPVSSQLDDASVAAATAAVFLSRGVLCPAVLHSLASYASAPGRASSSPGASSTPSGSSAAAASPASVVARSHSLAGALETLSAEAAVIAVGRSAPVSAQLPAASPAPSLVTEGGRMLSLLVAAFVHATTLSVQQVTAAGLSKARVQATLARAAARSEGGMPWPRATLLDAGRMFCSRFAALHVADAVSAVAAPPPRFASALLRFARGQSFSGAAPTDGALTARQLGGESMTPSPLPVLAASGDAGLQQFPSGRGGNVVIIRGGGVPSIASSPVVNLPSSSTPSSLRLRDLCQQLSHIGGAAHVKSSLAASTPATSLLELGGGGSPSGTNRRMRSSSSNSASLLSLPLTAVLPNAADAHVLVPGGLEELRRRAGAASSLLSTDLPDSSASPSVSTSPAVATPPDYCVLRDSLASRLSALLHSTPVSLSISFDVAKESGLKSRSGEDWAADAYPSDGDAAIAVDELESPSITSVPMPPPIDACDDAFWARISAPNAISRQQHALSHPHDSASLDTAWAFELRSAIGCGPDGPFQGDTLSGPPPSIPLSPSFFGPSPAVAVSSSSGSTVLSGGAFIVAALVSAQSPPSDSARLTSMAASTADATAAAKEPSARASGGDASSSASVTAPSASINLPLPAGSELPTPAGVFGSGRFNAAAATAAAASMSLSPLAFIAAPHLGASATCVRVMPGTLPGALMRYNGRVAEALTSARRALRLSSIAFGILARGEAAAAGGNVGGSTATAAPTGLSEQPPQGGQSGDSAFSFRSLLAEFVVEASGVDLEESGALGGGGVLQRALAKVESEFFNAPPGSAASAAAAAFPSFARAPAAFAAEPSARLPSKHLLSPNDAIFDAFLLEMGEYNATLAPPQSSNAASREAGKGTSSSAAVALGTPKKAHEPPPSRRTPLSRERGEQIVDLAQLSKDIDGVLESLGTSSLPDNASALAPREPLLSSSEETVDDAASQPDERATAQQGVHERAIHASLRRLAAWLFPSLALQRLLRTLAFIREQRAALLAMADSSYVWDISIGTVLSLVDSAPAAAAFAAQVAEIGGSKGGGAASSSVLETDVFKTAEELVALGWRGETDLTSFPHDAMTFHSLDPLGWGEAPSGGAYNALGGRLWGAAPSWLASSTAGKTPLSGGVPIFAYAQSSGGATAAQLPGLRNCDVGAPFVPPPNSPFSSSLRGALGWTEHHLALLFVMEAECLEELGRWDAAMSDIDATDSARSLVAVGRGGDAPSGDTAVPSASGAAAARARGGSVAASKQPPPSMRRQQELRHCHHQKRVHVQIALAPTEVVVDSLRGSGFEVDSALAGACRHFERCLALKPSWPTALEGLARLLLRRACTTFDVLISANACALIPPAPAAAGGSGGVPRGGTPAPLSPSPPLSLPVPPPPDGLASGVFLPLFSDPAVDTKAVEAAAGAAPAIGKPAQERGQYLGALFSTTARRRLASSLHGTDTLMRLLHVASILATSLVTLSRSTDSRSMLAPQPSAASGADHEESEAVQAALALTETIRHVALVRGGFLTSVPLLPMESPQEKQPAPAPSGEGVGASAASTPPPVAHSLRIVSLGEAVVSFSLDGSSRPSSERGVPDSAAAVAPFTEHVGWASRLVLPTYFGANAGHLWKKFQADNATRLQHQQRSVVDASAATDIPLSSNDLGNGDGSTTLEVCGLAPLGLGTAFALFNSFDGDRDGILSGVEFKNFWDAMGATGLFASSSTNDGDSDDGSSEAESEASAFCEPLRCDGEGVEKEEEACERQRRQAHRRRLRRLDAAKSLLLASLWFSKNFSCGYMAPAGDFYSQNPGASGALAADATAPDATSRKKRFTGSRQKEPESAVGAGPVGQNGAAGGTPSAATPSAASNIVVAAWTSTSFVAREAMESAGSAAASAHGSASPSAALLPARHFMKAYACSLPTGAPAVQLGGVASANTNAAEAVGSSVASTLAPSTVHFSRAHRLYVAGAYGVSLPELWGVLKRCKKGADKHERRGERGAAGSPSGVASSLASLSVHRPADAAGSSSSSSMAAEQYLRCHIPAFVQRLVQLGLRLPSSLPLRSGLPDTVTAAQSKRSDASSVVVANSGTGELGPAASSNDGNGSSKPRPLFSNKIASARFQKLRHCTRVPRASTRPCVAYSQGGAAAVTLPAFFEYCTWLALRDPLILLRALYARGIFSDGADELGSHALSGPLSDSAAAAAASSVSPSSRTASVDSFATMIARRGDGMGDTSPLLSPPLSAASPPLLSYSGTGSADGRGFSNILRPVSPSHVLPSGPAADAGQEANLENQDASRAAPNLPSSATIGLDTPASSTLEAPSPEAQPVPRRAAHHRGSISRLSNRRRGLSHPTPHPSIFRVSDTMPFWWRAANDAANLTFALVPAGGGALAGAATAPAAPSSSQRHEGHAVRSPRVAPSLTSDETAAAASHPVVVPPAPTAYATSVSGSGIDSGSGGQESDDDDDTNGISRGVAVRINHFASAAMAAASTAPTTRHAAAPLAPTLSLPVVSADAPVSSAPLASVPVDAPAPHSSFIGVCSGSNSAVENSGGSRGRSLRSSSRGRARTGSPPGYRDSIVGKRGSLGGTIRSLSHSSASSAASSSSSSSAPPSDEFQITSQTELDEDEPTKPESSEYLGRSAGNVALSALKSSVAAAAPAAGPASSTAGSSRASNAAVSVLGPTGLAGEGRFLGGGSAGPGIDRQAAPVLFPSFQNTGAAAASGIVSVSSAAPPYYPSMLFSSDDDDFASASGLAVAPALRGGVSVAPGSAGVDISLGQSTAAQPQQQQVQQLPRPPRQHPRSPLTSILSKWSLLSKGGPHTADGGAGKVHVATNGDAFEGRQNGAAYAAVPSPPLHGRFSDGGSAAERRPHRSGGGRAGGAGRRASTSSSPSPAASSRQLTGVGVVSDAAADSSAPLRHSVDARALATRQRRLSRQRRHSSVSQQSSGAEVQNQAAGGGAEADHRKGHSSGTATPRSGSGVGPGLLQGLAGFGFGSPGGKALHWGGRRGSEWSVASTGTGTGTATDLDSSRSQAGGSYAPFASTASAASAAAAARLGYLRSLPNAPGTSPAPGGGTSRVRSGRHRAAAGSGAGVSSSRRSGGRSRAPPSTFESLRGGGMPQRLQLPSSAPPDAALSPSYRGRASALLGAEDLSLDALDDILGLGFGGSDLKEAAVAATAARIPLRPLILPPSLDETFEYGDDDDEALVMPRLRLGRGKAGADLDVMGAPARAPSPLVAAAGAAASAGAAVSRAEDSLASVASDGTIVLNAEFLEDVMPPPLAYWLPPARLAASPSAASLPGLSSTARSREALATRIASVASALCVARLPRRSEILGIAMGRRAQAAMALQARANERRRALLDPRKPASHRLFDYACVVSRGPLVLLSQGTSLELQVGSTLGFHDLEFQPRLVERVPPAGRDWLDFPFPEQIGSFAFPAGMFLHQQTDAAASPHAAPPPPQLLSFVLTNDQATPMYCVALVFYEPLSPPALEAVFVHPEAPQWENDGGGTRPPPAGSPFALPPWLDASLVAGAAAGGSSAESLHRPAASSAVFSPSAMILCSHHPIFGTMRKTLRALYRLNSHPAAEGRASNAAFSASSPSVSPSRSASAAGARAPLDAFAQPHLSAPTLPLRVYLEHVVYDVPLPPRGRASVGFTLGDAHIIVARPPPNDLPLLDAPMAPLFQCLSPHSLLFLVSALLCERSVCLVSKHVTLLTPVAEALLSLLFPFKWPHTYIPVLVRSMAGVVGSPTPFLCGWSGPQDDVEVFSTSCVFANLDSGAVTVLSTEQPPKIPDAQRKKLLNALSVHAYGSGAMPGPFVASAAPDASAPSPPYISPALAPLRSSFSAGGSGTVGGKVIYGADSNPQLLSRLARSMTLAFPPPFAAASLPSAAMAGNRAASAFQTTVTGAARASMAPAAEVAPLSVPGPAVALDLPFRLSPLGAASAISLAHNADSPSGGGPDMSIAPVAALVRAPWTRRRAAHTHSAFIDLQALASRVDLAAVAVGSLLASSGAAQLSESSSTAPTSSGSIGAATRGHSPPSPPPGGSVLPLPATTTSTTALTTRRAVTSAGPVPASPADGSSARSVLLDRLLSSMAWGWTWGVLPAAPTSLPGKGGIASHAFASASPSEPLRLSFSSALPGMASAESALAGGGARATAASMSPTWSPWSFFAPVAPSAWALTLAASGKVVTTSNSSSLLMSPLSLAGAGAAGGGDLFFTAAASLAGGGARATTTAGGAGLALGSPRTSFAPAMASSAAAPFSFTPPALAPPAMNPSYVAVDVALQSADAIGDILELSPAVPAAAAAAMRASIGAGDGTPGSSSGGGGAAAGGDGSDDDDASDSGTSTTILPSSQHTGLSTTFNPASIRSSFLKLFVSLFKDFRDHVTYQQAGTQPPALASRYVSVLMHRSRQRAALRDGSASAQAWTWWDAESLQGEGGALSAAGAAPAGAGRGGIVASAATGTAARSSSVSTGAASTRILPPAEVIERLGVPMPPLPLPAIRVSFNLDAFSAKNPPFKEFVGAIASKNLWSMFLRGLVPMPYAYDERMSPPTYIPLPPSAAGGGAAAGGGGSRSSIAPQVLAKGGAGAAASAGGALYAPFSPADADPHFFRRLPATMQYFCAVINAKNKRLAGKMSANFNFRPRRRGVDMDTSFLDDEATKAQFAVRRHVAIPPIVPLVGMPVNITAALACAAAGLAVSDGSSRSDAEPGGRAKEAASAVGSAQAKGPHAGGARPTTVATGVISPPPALLRSSSRRVINPGAPPPPSSGTASSAPAAPKAHASRVPSIGSVGGGVQLLLRRSGGPGPAAPLKAPSAAAPLPSDRAE